MVDSLWRSAAQRADAKALNDAPDMQIARQRITLAEAQAKAAMAADGPQIDFSADD
jgi:outer membrane protein TolC